MANGCIRVLRVGRARLPTSAGGKAVGLSWLHRRGYPTPNTWVILPPEAEPARTELEHVLAGIVDPERRYAVRSSADVEDGAEHSFAGQFETVLDVQGLDAVVDAVQLVLRGAESDSAKSYASARLDSQRAVRMAVVVQEMVHPVMSGVAFSANPVTGFTETIIEAVTGTGEGLVQRGETPERWIWKAGAWKAMPKPNQLPEKVAERLASDVARMAKRFGRPIDVEWVLGDDGPIYVQVRPITGIGTITYYSNRFSREVLPGIIVPLVWSVNIPLVNGAWIRLLEQLVGPTGLAPADLAARLYCRAYFNMGALGTVFDMLGLPRESLELLSGMEKSDGRKAPFRVTLKSLSKVPRVLAFAARLPGYERRAARELAELRRTFVSLRGAVDLEADDVEAVLDTLDVLKPIMAAIAYLNVLTPLLSEAHNHRVARRLKRVGLSYESVDFANRDEGDDGRDPAAGILELHELSMGLPAALRERVRTGGVAALRAEPSARGFVARFDRFIETYGHFSDSGNDFSYVPWREDPAAVVRLIDAQSGGRPSTRKVTRADIAGVRRGRSCLRSFDRAARFQVLREDVSSFYTLCYGFQRPLFLRLSALLGVGHWPPLGRAIFYLTEEEVRGLVAGDLSAGDAQDVVRSRFDEEEEVRDAIVPDVVFGDVAEPLHVGTGKGLSGVATSPGRHTGRAVKIATPSQAPELAEGDVIVVPYSDVAWTPLFARAGAIVAESGGFLSHTSIVAREFAIPAVVSVPGAMHLIAQGVLVEVDGYTGTVTVVSSSEEPASGNSQGGVPA